MPKRKQGGINNTRPRGGKNKWKPIEYADPKFDQQYGTIKDAATAGEFNVITLNNDIKLAILKGSLKQTRINKGDWVLIEPVSSENGKYRIMFKYTTEQYKSLEREGLLKKIEIPVAEETPLAGISTFNTVKKDDGFCFAGEEDDIRKMLNIDDGFIDDI